MTARKISLVLTEPQFEALASAVAMADNEWEQDGTAPTSGTRTALRNGWSRINVAWYEKAHAAARYE